MNHSTQDLAIYLTRLGQLITSKQNSPRDEEYCRLNGANEILMAELDKRIFDAADDISFSTDENFGGTE